jgi:hypothetical protein
MKREAHNAGKPIVVIDDDDKEMNRDRGHYLGSNRASVMGARLFEHLPRHPIVTVKSALRLCDTTRPTAAKAIGSLCDAGILEETSGRKRDRTYTYMPYLDLLRVGTELKEPVS